MNVYEFSSILLKNKICLIIITIIAINKLIYIMPWNNFYHLLFFQKLNMCILNVIILCLNS